MGRSPLYYPLNSPAYMPQEEVLEVVRRKEQMIIGIPKDTSRFENRIPLTPQGVELLVNSGHDVILESEAGAAANYSDLEYSEAGAIIVRSREEVYKAQVVLKVSPPTNEEISLLTPSQLVISQINMHDQSRETIKKMMDKRINAIGYEIFRDESGSFPVIRGMSEIEGYAAIMIASEFLSKAHNGKGVLFGGITGISPAEVVILGAGTAGEYAARAALGLGALVKVFDNSYSNLRELQHNLGQHVFTSVLHPHALEKALRSADAVLGSMQYLQTGLSFMVTEEQVSKMKKGAVIVDLSMAQGGCFESSMCTDFDHPVFKKHGVIHYCVPNISSRVARTASIVLSNIFTPLLLQIADLGGIHNLIKSNIGVSNGVYIYKGILTNNQIGKQFDLPSKDIGLLMAAF